ncbi:unnamed protein product, partial [Soboliphyme baturini]|uniref:AMOP domain protein n=1 Tax=Soboliphyme baturini TaxID=241478 RepID=A0A183IAJ1_9BILA
MTGATQVCCYDFAGWLMFSQDFDYTEDYVKYYAAGVAYRADPWGAYMYKKPPNVPSWSNFYNDLLPYDVCCRWAKHCEFYYWRRPTSSCQGYLPSRIGTIYGSGHVITFDGTKYDFHGSGDYVLIVLKSPNIDLSVQIRMETIPKSKSIFILVSVVTGVAVQDTGSSVIQVLARKEHKRWRYRTDIFADSLQYFL